MPPHQLLCKGGISRQLQAQDVPPAPKAMSAGRDYAMSEKRNNESRPCEIYVLNSWQKHHRESSEKPCRPEAPAQPIPGQENGAPRMRPAFHLCKEQPGSEGGRELGHYGEAEDGEAHALKGGMVHKTERMSFWSPALAGAHLPIKIRQGETQADDDDDDGASVATGSCPMQPVTPLLLSHAERKAPTGVVRHSKGGSS
ncbi:hypothetical protein GW7_16180 [Heterocephalus glaber]|uniref:Uncharacterized protein n=1 Tax=Heterocephalus glaber TaxID=10181 RepID=G5B487_HETGA|nr:hypothetical protein GW7_16180 [Heterocephalus glaber]